MEELKGKGRLWRIFEKNNKHYLTIKARNFKENETLRFRFRLSYSDLKTVRPIYAKFDSTTNKFMFSTKLQKGYRPFRFLPLRPTFIPDNKKLNWMIPQSRYRNLLGVATEVCLSEGLSLDKLDKVLFEVIIVKFGASARQIRYRFRAVAVEEDEQEEEEV